MITSNNRLSTQAFILLELYQYRYEGKSPMMSNYMRVIISCPDLYQLSSSLKDNAPIPMSGEPEEYGLKTRLRWTCCF